MIIPLSLPTTPDSVNLNGISSPLTSETLLEERRQQALGRAIMGLAGNTLRMRLHRAVAATLFALSLLFGGCTATEATIQTPQVASVTIAPFSIQEIGEDLNALALKEGIDPAAIKVIKEERGEDFFAVKEGAGIPEVLAIKIDGMWHMIQKDKNPFYYKEEPGKHSVSVCPEKDPEEACSDTYWGVIYLKTNNSDGIKVAERKIVKRGYCEGKGPTGCSWGEGSKIGEWNPVREDMAKAIQGLIKSTTPTEKPTEKPTEIPAQTPTKTPTEMTPQEFHDWVEKGRKEGRIRVTCDVREWEDGGLYEIAFDTQTRTGVAARRVSEERVSSEELWKPIKEGDYFPCYRDGDPAVCRWYGNGDWIAKYKKICDPLGGLFWCEENWFMNTDRCRLP
uniref:Uncharacterized protein n=1 Tax=candidate division CPR3 bacterium TaxID=2268181 RepID=A0A7C5YYQ1_UNCC3